MFSEKDLKAAKQLWETDHPTSSAPAFNEIGHVLGVDVGPKIKGDVEQPENPCLRFYVEKKIDPIGAIKDERFRIEPKYREFPTDVIEIGRLVSFQAPASAPQAGPGSSIGLDPRDLPANLNTGIAGTVGAVVKMRGKHYILSSNHAMAVNGRATGMQVIMKPPKGFIDDPIDAIFARITDHVHLEPGLNQVDCALAELDEYRSLRLDRVKAQFPNGLVIPKDGIDPVVGMKVKRVDEEKNEEKTGRIVSVDAKARFYFSFGAYDFEKLVLIEGDDEDRPFARPGDSGALVVGRNKAGEKYQATALVIGGSRRKMKSKDGKWKSYTLACSFNTAIEKLEAELEKPLAGIAPSSDAPDIELVFTLPEPELPHVSSSEPEKNREHSRLRNRRLSKKGGGFTSHAGG